MYSENTFNPNPLENFSNRYCCMDPGAMLSYNCSLEWLKALLVTLLNINPNLYCISY